MSNILIGYTTNADSTREVAETMANEINKTGHTATAKNLSHNLSLAHYDAVIVGAPIILGWHTVALDFIKKHQTELANKKVAYFACSLKLTKNPAADLDSIPLELDPSLAADPKDSRKLQFEERFTAVDHYLGPIISAAPSLKPVSIGFFNGKLDMSKLNLFQKIFVRFIVQAEPGDFRNWEFIKNWSKEMGKKFSTAN